MQQYNSAMSSPYCATAELSAASHLQAFCRLLTKALEHHDSVASFAWMQHQPLSSAPDRNLSVSASGLQESRHSTTEYMLTAILCHMLRRPWLVLAAVQFVSPTASSVPVHLTDDALKTAATA